MGDNKAAEEGANAGKGTALHDNIVWDGLHNSPQAEIVLVSKDMIGFRVYAWYMRRTRELLELPPSTSKEIGPIYLNQTAEIVRHFIHCASSVGSDQYIIKLDAADYKNTLELCDFLQAPSIERSLGKSIATIMESKDYDGQPNAWEVFRFAANRDDFSLAKLAIGCFDRSGVNMKTMIGRQPPSHYSDIPWRYVYALFRSFVNRGGHWNDEEDAAANFQLT